MTNGKKYFCKNTLIKFEYGKKYRTCMYQFNIIYYQLYDFKNKIISIKILAFFMKHLIKIVVAFQLKLFNWLLDLT